MSSVFRYSAQQFSLEMGGRVLIFVVAILIGIMVQMNESFHLNAPAEVVNASTFESDDADVVVSKRVS